MSWKKVKQEEWCALPTRRPSVVGLGDTELLHYVPFDDFASDILHEAFTVCKATQ
jgi:hypothetical protein